jgi:hypothetical protein
LVKLKKGTMKTYMLLVVMLAAVSFGVGCASNAPRRNAANEHFADGTYGRYIMETDPFPTPPLRKFTYALETEPFR